MKIQIAVAATLLAISPVLVTAHSEGHGQEYDAPSAAECAQLAKLSKADAEKASMQKLRAQCEAAGLSKPVERQKADGDKTGL